MDPGSRRRDDVSRMAAVVGQISAQAPPPQAYSSGLSSNKGCLWCSFTSSRLSDLLTHMKTSHPYEYAANEEVESSTSRSVAKRYKCFSCHAAFSRTGNLMDHVSKYHHSDSTDLQSSATLSAHSNHSFISSAASSSRDLLSAPNGTSAVSSAAAATLSSKSLSVSCNSAGKSPSSGLVSSTSSQGRKFAKATRTSSSSTSDRAISPLLLTTALAARNSSSKKVTNSVAGRGQHICPYCKVNCLSRKNLMSHLDDAHRDCDEEEYAPPAKLSLLSDRGGRELGFSKDQLLPVLAADTFKNIPKNNALIKRLLRVIEDEDDMSSSSSSAACNSSGGRMEARGDGATSQHPTGVVRDKRFKCFWCDQVFRKRGKLMDHIDEIHKHSKDQNELEAEILNWETSGKDVNQKITAPIQNLVVPRSNPTPVAPPHPLSWPEAYRNPFSHPPPSKICRFELKGPTHRLRELRRKAKRSRRVCTFISKGQSNPLNSKPNSDRLAPVFIPHSGLPSLGPLGGAGHQVPPQDPMGCLPPMPQSFMTMLYHQQLAADRRAAACLPVPLPAAFQPTDVRPTPFFSPFSLPRFYSGGPSAPAAPYEPEPMGRAQPQHYIEFPLDLSSGGKRRNRY